MRAHQRFGAVLLLVVVTSAGTSSPEAAADLDPGFGNDGIVLTDVSGGYDEARAIAIDANGRIVVVGVSGTGSGSNFAIVRYNADGALDRTFGAGGTVITDFSGGSDVAWALALQPDGKILAAGEANGDFAVARYDSSGALDNGFGVAGKATIDFGGEDRAQALALQRDGKVVVAGFAARLDVAVARYGSDGILDPTFGTAGRLTTDFSGSNDAAFDVSIQVDGRIIVAGATGGYPSAQFALARYNADGSLDAAFGTGGIVAIGFGNDSRARALWVRPDGKIVTGGFVNNGSSNDAALTRLHADGTVDMSFGVSGRVLTDFGGRNFGNALAIQSDGRIVVVGADDFPPFYDFVVARYEGDGREDRTFGRDGRILTEFGGNSWINAVAIQPDGNIIAAGYVRAPSNANFALVRYAGGR